MHYVSFIKKFLRSTLFSFLVVLPTYAMVGPENLSTLPFAEKLSHLDNCCKELSAQLQQCQNNPIVGLVLGNLWESSRLLHSDSLINSPVDYTLCQSLLSVIHSGFTSLDINGQFSSRVNYLAVTIFNSLKFCFMDRFNIKPPQNFAEQSPMMANTWSENGLPVGQQGHDHSDINPSFQPEQFFPGEASVALVNPMQVRQTPVRPSIQGPESQLQYSFLKDPTILEDSTMNQESQGAEIGSSHGSWSPFDSTLGGRQ